LADEVVMTACPAPLTPYARFVEMPSAEPAAAVQEWPEDEVPRLEELSARLKVSAYVAEGRV
jgi:hypothetical protein